MPGMSKSENVYLRHITARKSTPMLMDCTRQTLVGPGTILPRQTRTKIFPSTRPFTGRPSRIRVGMKYLGRGWNANEHGLSRIRRDIIESIGNVLKELAMLCLPLTRWPDDPYSIEQLKAPRMNISVVRPLVETFYKMQDVSVGM